MGGSPFLLPELWPGPKSPDVSSGRPPSQACPAGFLLLLLCFFLCFLLRKSHEGPGAELDQGSSESLALDPLLTPCHSLTT